MLNVWSTVYSPSETETFIEALPNQSGLGENDKLAPSKSIDPLPDNKLALYDNDSLSTSDASKLRVKTSSSFISWSETKVSTGASLIGVTVKINVWLSESCVSVTVTNTSISP